LQGRSLHKWLWCVVLMHGITPNVFIVVLVCPLKDVIHDCREKAHDGESRAPSLNYGTALVPLHDYVMHSSSWSEYNKIKAWTMVLFAIWFGARPSELAEHCPCAETIEVPQSSDKYASVSTP